MAMFRAASTDFHHVLACDLCQILVEGSVCRWSKHSNSLQMLFQNLMWCENKHGQNIMTDMFMYIQISDLDPHSTNRHVGCHDNIAMIVEKEG